MKKKLIIALCATVPVAALAAFFCHRRASAKKYF